MFGVWAAIFVHRGHLISLTAFPSRRCRSRWCLEDPHSHRILKYCRIVCKAISLRTTKEIKIPNAIYFAQYSTGNIPHIY
ncbi:hypothetical protein DFS33DRAFT_1349100 [Desarmillaria ectypa]|nr:hypothetical protein DFS33DRAFT_1349100 [Desarmillaria ectypa]